MRRRGLLTVACVATIVAVGVARASEPRHGLSLFGQLKYPPGFAHFDYVDPDALKGGALRMPSLGSFISLNPFIRQRRAPLRIEKRLYDTLLTQAWDEPFSFYGLLAESVELSDDGRWAEYRLRPEARWHDGRPVTADDVVFTVEILKAKGSPKEKMLLLDVTGAERQGIRTVRIHFSEGASRQLPLQVSGEMEILPQHYWVVREFGETTLEPPLGSGPYRVAELDVGRSISFERVRDYWGRDLNVNVGRFNFDRIQQKYYHDWNVMVEAIKGRMLDWKKERMSKVWMLGYDFPARDRGHFVQELIWNKKPTQQNLMVLNQRKQKLRDPRVREALLHAYDQPLIVKVNGYSVHPSSRSFFAGSELAHRGPPGPEELALLEPFRDRLDPRLFERQWDPPASSAHGRHRENLLVADRLLREAGWIVRDGVRVSAETGEPFELDAVTISQGAVPHLLFFADALKRLGIEMTIRTPHSAGFMNLVGVERDFDLTVSIIALNVTPGTELRNHFGSRAAKRPYTLNMGGIENPAVDFLIDRIIGARSRAELLTAAHALDRVLWWGFYYISMGQTVAAKYAYWNIFGRPEKSPSYPPLGFPDTWWIDPAKLAMVDSGQPLEVERAELR